MTRFRSVLAAAALGAACTQQPAPPASLQLAADEVALTADGVDRTTIRARPPRVVDGMVVRFTATSGLLSSSAAVPKDGVAEVVLVADREEDLGDDAERTATVRAIVEWTDAITETAAIDVVMTAPTGGAPILFAAADPPAANADGAATITLTVTGRRLPEGGTLAWTTTIGALASATTTVVDGASSTTLTAPLQPGRASVRATEPASGVSAEVLVDFVAVGAPQFDLTGTFVQHSPARVKLTAGTLTPNPQCVLAPAIQKVEILQQGAEVDVRYTTCLLTLPPVTSVAGEVTTSTPPAFTASVPVVEQHVTLDDVAIGARWEPPESVVVSGAELANPRTDALPVNEDDPRVRDDDGDGEPGLTVTASIGGEQHIAYRNFGRTRGIIESSNRIVGAALGDLVARTESSVFGVGASFAPQVTALPSVVELVRVDGRNGATNADADGDGAVSCQEIIDAAANALTLAAPATPKDCGGGR